MSAIQYAKDKLTSTIALLVELQSNDFPYQGPLDALAYLEERLKDRRNDLSTRINPNETDPYAIEHVVNPGIKQATREVSIALEFAGYIFNSSNVRNIFEVHSPLLHIARRFIDHPQQVQLILSFEWNYVPFTYPLNVPQLPNFVVIGLPASESFNSLIIPAAGHELGHTVWRVNRPNRKYSYEEKYYIKLTRFIPSLISREFWHDYEKLNHGITKSDLKAGKSKSTWNLPFQWSRRQLQEIFCDLIGLGLFGESYLHAFKYLIAPSIGERHETYPASRQRAAYLVKASQSDAFKVKVPTDFIKSFEDEPVKSGSKEYSLLLAIADRCTTNVFDELLQDATKFLARKNHQVPRRRDWRKIVSDFKNFVPTSNGSGLAEIINAGWQVYHDSKYLSEGSSTNGDSQRSLEDRRLLKINELVLKSVEIYEIKVKLDEYRNKNRS